MRCFDLADELQADARQVGMLPSGRRGALASARDAAQTRLKLLKAAL